MNVGQKVKAYLETNEILQKELSDKTGISCPKLNLILNGKRKMNFDDYEVICEALGVDMAYFLEAKKPQGAA